MFGFADGWVAVAYLCSIVSAVICVVVGLKYWNHDDVMPDPVHPAGENLEFEETI